MLKLFTAFFQLSLACFGNTWGFDCIENCSIYCKGLNSTNSCNHTTGECLHGCLSDREDPHCLTCNVFSFVKF